MSLEELLNLEVTSVSRRPERLSATASAIQVITGEDIRRSGFASIPEVLRLASNLEVARINANEWAITARGFNNALANKMLVLIDGRVVYTPLNAGVFWDVQDRLLEDIERIEVISGPGATQWGVNAVNGVINIITKEAQDTQGALVTASVGTELERIAGARYGGSVGRGLAYRLYAKYSDRDDSVLPDGQDAEDAWNIGLFGLRMDWDEGDDDQATLQGDLYDGSIGLLQPSSTDVDGLNVLGRWSRTLAENSSVHLQVYYDHTHRDVPNGIAQDLEAFDLDLQHRFALGAAHDLVWGLTYRRVDDDISNPPVIGFLPSHVQQEWVGAFVQDEIALVHERLYLTIGTKVERTDYTDFEWQPSVRLGWTPTHRQTLWGAVSRAVRTPARIDRDFFVPSSPPFLLAGGPDFVSEKLLAYEAGYRVQPRRGVALGLATFYHDYDDLRSIEPLNPPAAFPAVIANGLRGNSYGAELTADYQVTETWRLRAGYLELRADSELKRGSFDRTSNRSTALDPDRQFLLRSYLDLPGQVEFDLTLRYVDSIAEQTVPAYTELDLRLGWQPESSWELAIVGQNLLHEQHPEFGALPVRKEIQRAVYGKITWSFE